MHMYLDTGEHAHTVDRWIQSWELGTVRTGLNYKARTVSRTVALWFCRALS